MVITTPAYDPQDRRQGRSLDIWGPGALHPEEAPSKFAGVWGEGYQSESK